MPSAGVLAWEVFRYSSRRYLLPSWSGIRPAWPSWIQAHGDGSGEDPGAGDLQGIRRAWLVTWLTTGLLPGCILEYVLFVPLAFFFLAQSRLIPIMRDYTCIQLL